MIRYIPFTLVLLQIISSCSPGNNSTVTVHYPGNESASDTAKHFARGLISTDSFEHSPPAFTPDGKTVLWSIIELPSWKATIMEMTYENDQWSVPHPIAFNDSTANDVYPSLSPDGKLLFFSSTRKLPSGEYPSKGNVLWKVERTENGWSIPQPLDTAISNGSTGGEYCTSMAKNGNLYFTYGAQRSPDWNIFMTKTNDGSLARPERLPSTINTPGYEDGPHIAPDESYLIFESDRPGGVEGSIDLYISFKSANGDWGVPINMGPKINTKASERFARVSPDGKFLFFGSNRRLVEGKTNFDTYWINATVITQLKEQAAQSGE